MNLLVTPNISLHTPNPYPSVIEAFSQQEYRIMPLPNEKALALFKSGFKPSKGGFPWRELETGESELN
jgi:hypothetical protein